MWLKAPLDAAAVGLASGESRQDQALARAWALGQRSSLAPQPATLHCSWLCRNFPSSSPSG